MKIVVVSVNCKPTHVAHIKAFYKLFDTLGHNVVLYLNPEYQKWMDLSTYNWISSKEELNEYSPDLCLIYNIGIENLIIQTISKRCGSKLVYTLHEPFPGWRAMIKEGASMPRAIAAYFLNALITIRSDLVMLPSLKAEENYKRYSKVLNDNSVYFPLIFTDEYNGNIKYSREFFSFIGTFSDPHGREEFLNFVRYAAEEDDQIKFLISTSTDISRWLDDSVLKHLASEGRLEIHHGRFMSTNEINASYRRSICTWAVYNRTTQSGVVLNALMQGSPVVARKIGNMETDIKDGIDGRLVGRDYSNGEILDAFRDIQQDSEGYSKRARLSFKQNNWFGSQIEAMRKILGSISLPS